MNEVTISTALNFDKGGASFISQPQSRQITVAGKLAIKNVKLIGTVDETLDLGAIGTIGYVQFRNLEIQVLIITPDAPTISNQGAAGAATASYKIVNKDSNGNYTAASAAGTTATSNATLDGTNFNRIVPTADAAAASYDIYRTAHPTSPATNGLIGNLLSSASPFRFDDTGLDGDSSTPPATGSDKIIVFGHNGTDYPNQLFGGEFGQIRWNAAAIHVKGLIAPVLLEYLIVER